jgi:hypothetical protein
MNLDVYFSSQAEALPRVSHRDRNEGALAFFGAENKRAKLQSPFLKVRRFLGSVFVGTKMEQLYLVWYFGKEFRILALKIILIIKKQKSTTPLLG